MSKKNEGPSWMNTQLEDESFPVPENVVKTSHRKEPLLILAGSLSRQIEPMRGVLVEMPVGLKDHFRERISGALGVGILILAQMKLAELEAAGVPAHIDVEVWRKLLDE